MPPLLPKLLTVLFFCALVVTGLTFDSAAQDAEAPTGEDPATESLFRMPKSGPFAPETISIPNANAISAWARSGHAAAASESFRHWDEDGEIPAVCATCHSGEGFRAFHGLDGGEAGLRDEPFPIGGVVDCETCHNSGLSRISEISLPSGVVHPVSGAEAACVTCHQGRSSGMQVESAVDGRDEDTPDAELRFINPHYNIGAATSLGSYGKVGFEYAGKSYSGRFNHAKPVASCNSCHDPHDLSVDEAICLTCHTSGDAAEIRISRQSYDGSGNTSQGIYRDIRANSDLLMATIRDYAAQVAGTPIIYDSARYPYFFADRNSDGRPDEAEGRPIVYNAFTPRLLKAVYNWKVLNADPGIHVHNPHYALELAYDSIEDLSAALDRDISDLGLAR